MKKILIIDDTKDLGKMLVNVFKFQDIDAISIDNGEQGLALLKDDKDIGLVITDIIMPDIDGLDVIDHIKKHHPDMPVIAMSGGGAAISADNIEKIIEDSVIRYLKKPLDIDELITLVKQHV